MDKNFPESLKLLTDTLWRIKEKEDLQNFIEDCFTPKEIIDLSDRIKIFELLLAWKNQREIASELKISVTTVNRGSRILQYWTWVINKIFNK